MAEEPPDRSGRTDQTASRSRTVSNFRSLLPRRLAGAKSGPDARGQSWPCLSGQASDWRAAQERTEETGEADDLAVWMFARFRASERQKAFSFDKARVYGWHSAN